MRLLKHWGPAIFQRRSEPILMTAFTFTLAVLSFTSLCNAQDKPKKKKSPPQFLFVQSAKSFTFADGKLSLHGVSPHTIYFTDRPVRIAGHVTVKGASARTSVTAKCKDVRYSNMVENTSWR